MPHFQREANRQINKIIYNLDNLEEEQTLGSLIDYLSGLNNDFENNIPTKDFNLLPADFSFEDQFTNIKKGDLLVFEHYYDEYLDKYGGPIFFVTGSLGKRNTQLYRLGNNGDFYILPSEAAPIITKNEGTTLEGIQTLYPTVDIEAINLSKDLNLKDQYKHRITGTYMFGTSSRAFIVVIDENLLYLGQKIHR